MSYNTYIINMADSTKRWNQISKHLDNIGINYSRFDAIDGRKIGNQYDEYISLAKPIIPEGVIGCALSHFMVAKEHFANNDNAALILEDDAAPLFKDKNVIHQVIEEAPKDWDIILLYAQGLTNYRDNTWQITSKFVTGACSAYLINKTGYHKRYNGGSYKVITHTDCERGLYEGNVYKTPQPLFIPCDRFEHCDLESSSTSNTYSANVLGDAINTLYKDDTESDITGCSGDQLFHYNVVKIPGTKVSLDATRIFMIIVPILALIITYNMNPNNNSIVVFIFVSLMIFLLTLLFTKSVFKIIGATQFHT
jgi:GR25 family glycosyltransferase involved in LPS biosynthesis